MEQSLLHQKQLIISEMTTYMNFGDRDEEIGDPDFEADYEQVHIDRCDTILTNFLNSMFARHGSSPEVLLQEVKSTIEALNALNAECDGGLIETDQREGICQIVQDALWHAGFNPEVDVTESWREW